MNLFQIHNMHALGFRSIYTYIYAEAIKEGTKNIFNILFINICIFKKS